MAPEINTMMRRAVKLLQNGLQKTLVHSSTTHQRVLFRSSAAGPHGNRKGSRVNVLYAVLQTTHFEPLVRIDKKRNIKYIHKL